MRKSGQSENTGVMIDDMQVDEKRRRSKQAEVREEFRRTCCGVDQGGGVWLGTNRGARV